MNQAERVLINTLAQYVRIICVIVITLYSTRIVLRELGSSDFGLYSLIGSVLAFLSFLNTTIMKTTQRYLSYYMGNADVGYQKIVLFNSVLLNFILSVVTCSIIVALMPYIVDGFLNIDADRIAAAKILYVFMCISVFFTINVSPFSAVFVAHENIVFSSIAYIAMSVMRLLAAIMICYISDEKLLWYSASMLLISCIEFLAYYFSTKTKYDECKRLFCIKFLDFKLMKSMMTFSFWNLYGTLCVMGRNQGYAFVINKFMTITANAAYGIANQVSGQISNFVFSLSNAISPIITKSQGAKDSKKMIFLSLASSKLSVLMFSLIALPVIFNIEFILRVWLGNFPDYTAVFVISIIIACFCDSYSVGLRTGIQAVGKIRNFSLCVYTVKIISIPASIILLVTGVDKVYIFVPYIITELLGTFITIAFFCIYAKLAFWNVISDSLKSLSAPIACSLLLCSSICNYMEVGVGRFVVSTVVITVSTMVAAYYCSLNKKERNTVKRLVLNFRMK